MSDNIQYTIFYENSRMKSLNGVKPSIFGNTRYNL